MPKFVVTDVSQCDLRVYRGYTVEAETAEQAIAMVHDPDQDHEPDWTDDKIVSEDDFDAWAVPAQEYRAERRAQDRLRRPALHRVQPLSLRPLLLLLGRCLELSG